MTDFFYRREFITIFNTVSDNNRPTIKKHL